MYNQLAKCYKNSSFELNLHMNNAKFFLPLLVLSALLVSCAPSFYLKGNQKLETISLKVEYGPKITPDQINIIQLNVNQFLTEYNQEKHLFKVHLSENDDDANIILKFNKFSSPRKFTQVTATVLSLGIGYSLLIINPSVGVFLVPFVQLNQIYNITECSYTISKSISDFPKKPATITFGTPRGFNSRNVELQQHLRSIDFQLGAFLDAFEKEYARKNNH